METKTALEVDKNMVARMAMGGLLAGGSSAALLNLVHSLREMQKKREEAAKPNETDENTIVITLPPKTAAMEKIIPATGTEVKHMKGRKGQPRRANGTMSQSTIKSAAGWPTLTAASLAAIASGGIGYALVDRIYQKRREAKLQAELDAAKQEYGDLLSGGGGKTAEALDSIFDIEGLQKDAGYISTPLAAVALLTILGSAGTAYVTKRVLDEKLHETNQLGMDVPKVKKIVFKSAPGTGKLDDDEKEVTAEDMSCLRCATAIMIDKVAGVTKILEVPEVKEAMAKAGTSARKLFKLAAEDDVTNLLDYLKGNEPLRKLIQRAALQKHPILSKFKWGLNVPGISGMADRQLYGQVENSFRPKLPKIEPAMLPKTAQMGLPVTATFASIIGSTIAGKGLASDIVQKTMQVQRAIDNQESAVKDKDDEENVKRKAKKFNPQEIASKIRITGADPKARLYVQKNKGKLLKVLTEMAESGKI